MRRVPVCLAIAALTLPLLGQSAPPEPERNPVVQQLSDLITRNGWEDEFAQAIASARSFNVPQLEEVKDLPGFLSWLDRLLRWVPVEDRAGKAAYNHLCMFYFILDQPPVRELQNPIEPRDRAAPLTELSSWMVDFARAWGAFLDTPESLTPESVQSFYDSPPFNMGDYMTAPGGWKTFNQFFARHVRPGARPIAAMGDDRVLVSPADSTFVGRWEINQDSKITVKGIQWSVLELLEGSPYAERFRGGIFMHSFLNTTDYHRLHVPVRGKVLESRPILGQVYLDVKAVPSGDGDGTSQIVAQRRFDAQDDTGYQFAQARGLIVVDSPIGLVAVLPIGMAQVSSVVMTADVGRTLHKGQEFAYFQFGGSDIVVCFEAASNVSLTMQPGVHYKQGTCIGQAFP